MTRQEFKKIRKELGFSQERLGKALGRQRRQIIRYENGDMVIPPWAGLAMESLVRKEKEG